ncbi:MAG: tetratricopeptide repeat protein [Desulfobacterales bacterium]|nr:tetratricopeptide repeat protein [Desulfobacterales bacterium]
MEAIVAASPDDHGDIGQLLEGVLENTTPLYKARTEELPPQQRRIIDAVALEWDPAHSSTIVKRTGLTASSVSSQLKRLQKDGLLHQVPLGSKRKGVQIAERFYNIWYLMRHGTRRNRLRLRWLSSFLSTYYSGAELNYQAKHLISNGNASRNIYSEALMHAIDDAPLQDALRHALTRPLIGEDNECLKNLLPDEDYDPKLLDHAQRLEKMLAGFIKSGVKKDEAEKLTRMITGSISLPPEAKQWFTDNAANLSRDDIKKWINELEAETRHFNRIIGKKTNQALGELFFAGNIASRTDTKGALAILSCNESATLIDIFLSIETFENGNIDELNRFLSHCKSTPPTTSAAWNGLGNLFQYKYKLNKYKKSENAYKKAIEINPQFASPWNGLGNLLQDHLNRFEESENAYKKAIEIDPKFAHPWNGLGNLLQNHLNRFEESENAYRKAIKIDPNYANPWNGLGNLLSVHLKRYEESEKAYKKAIEIDPQFANPWNGLGNLFQDHLNRYEESENAYKKAIEIDSNNSSSPKANLIWLKLKSKDHLKAKELASEINLPFPGNELIQATCDLVAGNPGSSCDQLAPIFRKKPASLWIEFRDDLLRLTRLVKAHQFDDFYLAFLRKNQFNLSMEPYVAATEAYFTEKDRLLRLNPEARTVAESLYGWLVSNSN